jgi:ornithine cyclodeaminase/alanine dehydrogenase-like protein (mu-crystallin family)
VRPVTVPFVDADRIRRLVSTTAAADAIRQVLLDGLDPATDPARIVVPTSGGQFLLMPSDAPPVAGVKIATVSPLNAAAGLPRIQGVYVLFDAPTMAPLAILDGPALTVLRTPAVSMVAVLPRLRTARTPLDVVVVGAGPQAIGHVRALFEAPSGRVVARVTHVLRSVGRDLPEYPCGPGRQVLLDSADAADALAHADVVVCATSARQALFDSRLLGDGVTVIAVGSHEPDAREVDGNLCERAQVVVEDPAAALRESGDIVIAVAEGHIEPGDLVPLKTIVTGAVPPAEDRPVLFKIAGMAWEDLAVARAVYERFTGDDQEGAG